jgi:AraC-like DNA-binding protein
LFYRFNFFGKAIGFYKISYKFATRSKDSWGQAVSFQNIALSFQNLKIYDSAFYYFQLAEQYIHLDNQLILAQNNTYLGDLMIEKGDTAKLNAFAQSINSNLVMFQRYLAEKTTKEKDRNYVTWNEIASNSHRILYIYNARIKNTNLSDYHFRQALKYADESGTTRLKAGLYFAKALFDGHQKDLDDYTRDVDSALYYFLKIHDWNDQKAFADSILYLSDKLGLLEMKQKFSALSHQFADSIVQMKISPEFYDNIMLMSSIAAEQSAQRLKLIHLTSNNIIFSQKLTIIFVFGVLTVLLVFFVIIIIQNRKITNANKAMIMQLESTLVVPVTGNGDNLATLPNAENLVQLMDSVMSEQKVYLKNDLSLNELASILETNTTYLSFYFHRKLNTNFNDYINILRVKEACQLMFDPENSQFTIEAIAENSGFNSKSTFYRAFRKFTGMSPVDFKRSRQAS